MQNFANQTLIQPLKNHRSDRKSQEIEAHLKKMTKLSESRTNRGGNPETNLEKGIWMD